MAYSWQLSKEETEQFKLQLLIDPKFDNFKITYRGLKNLGNSKTSFLQ